jgi:long-chain acyl-CoA synthetase
LPSVPRTVARVLDRALAERPDAPAVVGRSGTLTYRELDAAADRAAGAFASWGVRVGDRIAVSLPNDLDVVVAFHGAMRIGAVWVGINGALVPAEKLHLLDDSAAVLLLTDTPLDAPCRVAQLDEWRALLQTAPGAPSVDVDPHAPAGIAYTSGTTGLPRGIVHSQHNLLLPGAVLVSTRGYDEHLRKGDCLPLTILNLMVLTTLLTAQAGGCCVVMDRRDAAGIAEWIRAEQVTVWNGVPAQLFDLVRGGTVTREELQSLQEVWSGGGDCSDALRAEFLEAFGLPLRATYGLTEAPTVVAIDPPGSEWVPGGSGQVLPHLRVEVVDDELCVTAAVDGPWAGTWTPMLGEWRDGAVVPGDALLRTGDLGTVEDGWLRVLDRRKLVVVRGGANVYPAEVERVLLTLPGVSAAAVFGVPDERLGERVAAVVQGQDLAVADLVAGCGRELSSYKVPERWAVVDALPRNAMGKVVRPALSGLLDEHESSQDTSAAPRGAHAGPGPSSEDARAIDRANDVGRSDFGP